MHKGLRKRSFAVRADRRKQGVNTENTGRFGKEISKNTLDTFWRTSDTPLAPVTAFPPKNVPTFLTYPHAGKINVSEEYRCLHIWKKKPC
jgi:hypothetical protein